MKWKTACCVILLLCLMLVAGHVMAVTGSTTITGSVPLVTYEVSTSRIGHLTATVSWKTNGDASSQVFYDTVSHDNIVDYAYYTRERKASVSEHKMTLNKLSPSTTYYCRVRSAAGGAESVSDEYTFTTLPAPGRRGGWLASLLLEFIYPTFLWWLW
ncbi:MAG: fibronectin type III domain-containing protein [Chloroflexota bacterium]|nr:MAG: fibronectin type III domain-containing protein [Chloroflexota bacterium]